MKPLWQTRLTTSGDSALAAELLLAATDGVSVSMTIDEHSQDWIVVVISETEPDDERLSVALAELTSLTGARTTMPVVSAILQRDWLKLNQRDFPPFDIGGFHIYGDHIKNPDLGGQIGLLISAGQAFGTGNHPTTCGCLQYLDRFVPQKDVPIIADIGTGSGILAIAAAKLYDRAQIIAVDNDAIAVKVAVENAALNGVSARIISGLSDGCSGEIVLNSAPYDLIFANILPSPLVSMAGEAVACLAEGGMIILSGLMTIHCDKVRDAYQKEGLSMCETIVIEDWVTLVMEK